jgi:LmbE family N-acetylglucosaminyl deacetylase
MLSPKLGRAVLVVAHPDDEVLWFSSILGQVGKIVVCFLEAPLQPECTAGRARVIEEYPLHNTTFIGLTESMTFRGADWAAPVPTRFGLEVRRGPGTLAGFERERYVSNYQELIARLVVLLEGATAVITHNPWGDYGHEEHVQVHRAVRELQRRLSFEVWYSNYCSERSHPLMMKSVAAFGGETETFATDSNLANRLMALYVRHGCWTWPFQEYKVPATETFFRHSDAMRERSPGASIPLNFVRLDDPIRTQQVSRRRRLARDLKRRIVSLVGALPI